MNRNFRTPASFLLRLAGVGLAAALVALAPRTAAAKSKLAVDLGYDFPSYPKTDDGWGFGVRYGQQWNITLLTLTPEIGFDYHDFSGAADPTAFRFVAGGRVGIDFGIEPSVFAHAGVGHVSANPGTRTSLGYDVGGALDLTILPIVSFGAHVMEAGIAGNDNDDAFTWLEVGGHVSFSF